MTTNVPSGASARLEPIDVTSHHRLSAVIFAPLTAESPGAERTPQGTASSLVPLQPAPAEIISRAGILAIAFPARPPFPPPRLPEPTLSPPPSQLPEQDRDAQQRRLVVGYHGNKDRSMSRNDDDDASALNFSLALSRILGETELDYDKRMAMSYHKQLAKSEFAEKEKLLEARI